MAVDRSLALTDPRCSPSRRQAKALFSKYDKDRSGGLDFDEFRKVMTVIAGEGVSDGSLLKAFEAVDTNGNGKIDCAPPARASVRAS